MFQEVQACRDVFMSGKTKVVQKRRELLESMFRLLDEQGDALCEALNKDLRKVGIAH